MPGLNQLKQFSTDILTLGDEQKIRAARGEIPSIFPIPADVEDRDDSDDFALGMPSVSEEELAQAEAAAAEEEKSANDFTDITGEETDENVPQQTGAPTSQKAPDVSDLLAPAADADLGDIDLSEFEEPAAPKEPPKPKEIPIEDLDLDALLAPKSKPQPAVPAAHQQPTTSPQTAAKPAVAKPEATKTAATKPAADRTTAAKEEASFEAEFPPELQAAFSNAKKPQQQQPASNPSPDDFSLDDLLQPKQSAPHNAATSQKNEADDLEQLESLEPIDEKPAATVAPKETPTAEETPSAAESSAAAEASTAQPTPEQAAPSNDDFAFEGNAIDLNEGLPQELDETPSAEEPAPDTTAEHEETPAADEAAPTGEAPAADETVPVDEASFAEEPPAQPQQPAENEAAPSDDFSLPEEPIVPETENTPTASTSAESTPTESTPIDEFDTSALDNLPDFGATAATEQPTGEAPASEPAAAAPTAGEATSPDVQAASPDISEAQAPGTEEAPIEKFDTSALDGIDFSGSNDEQPTASTDSTGPTDFELGNFGASTDSTDSFNIPGFSDTTTAKLGAAKKPLSSPNFSNAKSGDKPKNTFTDAEYKRFEKNLSEYPLNVRVALEDLVVKNEFTDDAVFAILEKVLRKVPAKQLATELEKMLDITLDVPRDYERRTADEYEAYKKSVEYQLKNRIIPGAILTAGAAVLVFCLFMIIKTFIYIPVTANSLYRKGYALLQHNEYPQSEMEFDRALTYKPIKKWFFRYAKGYRDHLQYDRATMMYRAILQRFDHDKQAGLDWADMELYDLFNYAESERILKREVLDYHISDPDALLLLGDTYLEWGTEKDPSKFESALEQYSLLLQLYGAKNQDLYLGRMMRYYIRTDNLQQVLQYKEHFFPLKKALGSQDLTELSGYLLDKRYGKLKPAEENLRFSIENVRELLERAVKADPNNPIALYNFGRYFEETANNASAKKMFQSALDAFAKQKIRNNRDTYKYINTYRLMGESNTSDKEYIPAEQMYDKGIELFEKERTSSGFASTEDIGKLYADLADLNYFVSGDMDSALRNYQNSINNKNDTPSIRYRVGYIQYNNKNYPDALGSFIVSSEGISNDTHLLLALANTLNIREDNYAAQGYYEKLLTILDKERQLHNVLLPQVREDQADIVDTYMKAANNLGVTLNRIAQQTGNSKLNAEAIVRLTESLRAWDALTRNQTSMVRLDGSNLPQQNIKYIDHPMMTYTPEIFTEIPRTLYGEKGLE